MLRRYWALILVLTVSGVGVAVAVALIVPPRYEVSSEIYVSVGTAAKASGEELQAAASFARRSVLSYAQYISTPYVLDGAAKRLDGKLSAADLKQLTEAYARTGTSIIRITVAQRDPQLAYDASSAVTDEAARVIGEEQRNPDSKERGPVLVEVVSPPQLPSSPVSPRMPIAIALGLFFGLAAGFIAAFATHAAQGSRRARSAARW
ncbi:hypothetical protein GCM10022381_41970 [Leifsonia kafniensis]|uniref:Polysaccharide chain length determinant N-terminal domain-containing protein n=2 Tax=Leifsonia kafniensis TaxID=475957 RepID=A0ABP7LAY0_9MICO